MDGVWVSENPDDIGPVSLQIIGPVGDGLLRLGVVWVSPLHKNRALIIELFIISAHVARRADKMKTTLVIYIRKDHRAFDVSNFYDVTGPQCCYVARPRVTAGVRNVRITLVQNICTSWNLYGYFSYDKNLMRLFQPPLKLNSINQNWHRQY